MRLFEGDFFKRAGFDSKTPEITRKQAEFIAEALGLQPGENALDVCCGIGRHAIILAEMGFEIVGLDFTPHYIECAEKSAGELGKSCGFVVGDMRKIPFEAKFDAAYNFFTSWGYFDDKTNIEVLKNISRALKPGGRFLLDTMNRDFLMRNFQPCFANADGEDADVIQYNRFDPATSTIHGEWIYLKKREIVHHSHLDLRVYSLHEICDRFRMSGLEPVKFWGSSLGDPFDFTKSNRCVVLGKKIS